MKDTKRPKTNKDYKRSKANGYKKAYLFKVCVWFFVVVCFVFFVLPTLFVLLGVMWPSVFSGVEAVKQLNENINSWVGIIGLALAVFSLYYSIETSNTANKLQEHSDNTLNSIIGEIANLKNEVSNGNQRIYDVVKDKTNSTLQAEDRSDEQ